jgi:hypothetical protein
MSYPDSLLVQRLLSASVTQTVADKANWSCGLYPEVIRGIALVVTTATTGPVGRYDLDKRPTAGSDTARGTADLGFITIPNAAQGVVIYKELNGKLIPGQQVVVELLTATTAGAVDVIILFEISPERPANNALMVAG